MNSNIRFTLRFNDPIIKDVTMPAEGWGTREEAEHYAITFHSLRYWKGDCEVIEFDRNSLPPKESLFQRVRSAMTAY